MSEMVTWMPGMQQFAFRAQFGKRPNLIWALLGTDTTNVHTVVNNVFLRHFPGLGVPNRVETVRVFPNTFVACPTVQYPFFRRKEFAIFVLFSPEFFSDFSKVFLADITDNARALESTPGAWKCMAVFWRGNLVPLHKMATASFDIVLLPGLQPGGLAKLTPLVAFSAFAAVSSRNWVENRLHVDRLLPFWERRHDWTGRCGWLGLTGPEEVHYHAQEGARSDEAQA